MKLEEGEKGGDWGCLAMAAAVFVLGRVVLDPCQIRGPRSLLQLDLSHLAGISFTQEGQGYDDFLLIVKRVSP